MENNNNHDKYFRELLQGNYREMPFSDFEDEVMDEIAAEHEKKNSFLKNIKISWLFFFFGIISGIVMAVLSTGVIEDSGVLQENLVYALAIIFCLIIVFLADNLFRLSFRHNN